MRIAIISTPRSGNSWVRRVLADVYDLAELAVHNPADIPVEIPEHAVLQLHWYREPGLQALLRRNGFRVLVLSRHPLDVLLSILQFVRHEPMTARWLEGNAELPAELARARPTSRLFREYALSWGAENVLNISYAWWHDKDVLRLRYEELVHCPEIGFGRLVAKLGGEPGSITDALTRSRLEVLQATANRHGWRGQPGLWKAMIPPATALRIHRRHRPVFRALGYDVGLYVLSARQAERRWEELTIPNNTAS